MADFEAKSNEFSKLLLEAETDEVAEWVRQQLQGEVSALDFLTRYSLQH